MDLKGKRVVVTGGSSGIGLALARAMLARGARVAIVGRRQVELDRAVAELKGSRRSAPTSRPLWRISPEGRIDKRFWLMRKQNSTAWISS